MEINKIVPNKQTFNKAYILFDDKKIAKKWLDVLIETNTEHTKFVWIVNNTKYYAFKMFRIKQQIFSLCLKLNEVLNDEQEESSKNYIYDDSVCVAGSVASNGTRVYANGYYLDSKSCAT